MKFFIDFEAQQFSNDIISIGCIAEDNSKFYSLVRPVRNKKISNLIKELTGITQEDLDEAPTSEEVFNKFWDWCYERYDGKLEFYCYGSCDSSFVKTNYKYTKDLKAKSILGLISLELINYAGAVTSHFGLKNGEISLIKVFNYYKKEENNQKHNALEDAIMLKYVYEQTEKREKELEVFTQNSNNKKKKNEQPKDNHIVYAFKDDECIRFESLNAAARWMAKKAGGSQSKNNFRKKIKRKAELENSYGGYKWKIKEENE